VATHQDIKQLLAAPRTIDDQQSNTDQPTTHTTTKDTWPITYNRRSKLTLKNKLGTPKAVRAHTKQPKTRLKNFSSGLPHGRTSLLLHRSISQHTRAEVDDRPKGLRRRRPLTGLDGKASERGCRLERRHPYWSGSRRRREESQ
jgi:hypothetical protein